MNIYIKIANSNIIIGQIIYVYSKKLLLMENQLGQMQAYFVKMTNNIDIFRNLNRKN